MEFTWITQGSFLFESEGFRLAVDPYLSDYVEKEHGLTRLKDPAFTVETLKPDAVFCTHNHIDHFDPVSMPQIAKKYEACSFAGPVSVIEKCKEFNLPMDNVLKIDIGGIINLGPFVIKALPAIHSDKDAVGVLIDSGGKKTFLTGDSEYSDDYLAEIKKSVSGVDLVLICINGRMGNMNADDALKVVRAVRPRKALPMHYGLFAENTADPSGFINGCSAIGVESFEMIQGNTYKL
jgi:L-ascorbate metabolism protein UlaG (beta-lactamase superfamily)